MSIDIGSVVVFDEYLINAANQLKTEILVKINTISMQLKSANASPNLAYIKDELNNVVSSLDMIVSCAGEWILKEFEQGTRLELVPVSAVTVSNKALFSKSKVHLYMSATICGFDAFCNSIGIPKEKAVFIDIPNPIPVENRPIFPLNFMKASGNFDRCRMAQLIDKIAARQEGQNGIVHTVSFKLAEELYSFSSLKHKMIVSSNRNEILDHLSKVDGRIVLSPSIEHGYDFKGDLSRWQVVAKLPYPFIGDPWIKLHLERDPKWYARKTIVRLIQACGRSVRGVDDWARTYIIDDQFKRLFSQNRELFPEWFVESIRNSN